MTVSQKSAILGGSIVLVTVVLAWIGSAVGVISLDGYGPRLLTFDREQAPRVLSTIALLAVPIMMVWGALVGWIVARMPVLLGSVFYLLTGLGMVLLVTAAWSDLRPFMLIAIPLHLPLFVRAVDGEW